MEELDYEKSSALNGISVQFNYIQIVCFWSGFNAISSVQNHLQKWRISQNSTQSKQSFPMPSFTYRSISILYVLRKVVGKLVNNTIIYYLEGTTLRQTDMNFNKRDPSQVYCYLHLVKRFYLTALFLLVLTVQTRIYIPEFRIIFFQFSTLHYLTKL